MIYAYGEHYNDVFDRRLIGPAYKLLSRARRAVRTALVRDADIVFHQRTAFPHTAIPEQILAARGVPSILDFDDAIYLGPGGVPSALRERAFRDAVAVADHCIAGNRHLAEVAGVPEKTTIIPTVIDTDRFVPAKKEPSDEVVVGWMGTAGNFPFLEHIVPAVKTVLAERDNVHVRLVSNAEFRPLSGHDRVEQIRWTAAREVELLQSFDIGLMPLEDTRLTRGKCAFKMIQYMAVGIPVVVSAVGANNEVMEGVDIGYGLDRFDEWADALLRLIDFADERAAMGAAGRERAVSSYSVTGVTTDYLDVFDDLR